MTDKEMPNHISEYFNEVEIEGNGRISKELFNVGENEEQLDFKTDVSIQEIQIITAMYYNDLKLKKMGFKPIYKPYYKKYLKLVISKDRKSRNEFVNLNKKDNSDDVLSKAGELSAITGAKK